MDQYYYSSRNNKMFSFPLLVLFLSHSLLGSAYVVLEEEDGYYRAWRTNPLEQKPNPWTSFMNPQNYLPFLQNMNPLSWMWQQQQPMMQENPALNVLYDRQKALFNIMKCLVGEEPKMMCKHLVGNAMSLFPGSMHVSEVWIINPDSPKPMESETTIMISKPAEAKPVVIEMSTMEMKPSVIQPEMTKPQQVEDPLSETKPNEMKMKESEEKPMTESATEMKIEATTMEAKPMEDSKPMEEPEMKPTEAPPAPMEMKPMEDNLKPPEAEAGAA